jgi:hypothetical protein
MKLATILLVVGIAALASAQNANPPTPKPEWVPDPSAGHYDCPDGWMAYSRSEPDVYHIGGAVAAYAQPAIYITPRLDKKGHVLNEQPPPPICIKESK